ncbi:endonuclease III domain-containing protein [Heliobacterium chlorum]|uniref:Endonuclease III domain-containing protein n=1 Tax=Heliobacterium chlorum TaxID=2698 RepID=A0ABR7T3P8_HELCL|nr:endonuclease III domain-containing protein [Heliobacterium chlorum]MBC9784842.1 endonuclease III domain-containing protein [Heliobacterium chlorum]
MDTRTLLLEIYQRLLNSYGARHWWPAESTFEVVIGAILTQNVAWKNVETAIENLKRENQISFEALASIAQPELADLIRSTRYYNQKAARLQEFARLILVEYEGKLENLFQPDVPELRKRLLDIRGIGKETADSIILYAAQKPIFVVDAYTRRTFSRVGLLPTDATYEAMQDLFANHLDEDLYLFQEYHAQIVGHGNRVCLARRPRCFECPLGEYCRKEGDLIGSLCCDEPTSLPD